MQHFKAHRLHFVTKVQTTIELNEHQGSALRGAFYHALRRKFCHFSYDRELYCARCSLVTTCPVATLVSTMDPGHERGRDRPRPYTVQPPLPGSGHPWEWRDGRVTFRYEPGETLSFGLTLYGEALALLPYVVLATAEFEKGGLGRRLKQPDGRWRRGTISVQEVWTDNPLTGERQPVIRKGTREVEVPDIPVTHPQVLENAELRMENAELRMWFLTPTRLIDGGRLLKPETFHFKPFFQRLLERLEALSEQFSDTPLHVDFPTLLQQARAVRLTENRLTWEEVRSYSTRRHRSSPRGGLMGRVTLQSDDWTPFLPWIIWGQFTHVGKSTVKGNGMYRI
ncbi:MAG: CRISPR system precrRNA processing endoribonuclease RAMP protein Cas6 [Anaerolineae bacterium]